MKIVEIIPSLGSGGGEKFVIDLSNALANCGHDCTIVTLYDPSASDILRPFIQDNVHTLSLGKKLGADLGCMMRMLKYIKSSRPEIVHVHLGAILYVLLAVLFCSKSKYIATIHSEARREAGTGLQKVVRKLLFKMGLVMPVTISPESEMSFRKFYGNPAVIILNGVAKHIKQDVILNQWSKYRSKVEYLFVHAGRIHNVKNQLLLVESFVDLLKRGYQVRLLIVGRIEDENLYDQIKNYLSDYIVYVGEQYDVRSIMEIADAFCLSSSMEGMPITVLEAMSVGCIPIVTPVGGCLNLIKDGKNGYVSKDLSKSEYTSAITRFIHSSNERKQAIRNQCLAEASGKYSIDRTAMNYLDLFRHVRRFKVYFGDEV